MYPTLFRPRFAYGGTSPPEDCNGKNLPPLRGPWEVAGKNRPDQSKTRRQFENARRRNQMRKNTHPKDPKTTSSGGTEHLERCLPYLAALAWFRAW